MGSSSSSRQNSLAESTIRSKGGDLDESESELDGETLDNPSPVYPLPNEILLCIVQCLELPVQDVITPIPPPEFLEYRKTLYNLCLTSRSFCEYARPLLYRTVIFFLCSRHDNNVFLARTYGSLGSLIDLIRTLLRKYEYCRYIENILCPAGFGSRISVNGEDSQYLETSDLRPQDLSDRQKFIMDTALLDNHSIRAFTTINTISLTQRLLAALLCLSYNLDTFLIYRPQCTRFMILQYILRQALKKGRIAILPRLSTLQIQQLDYSNKPPKVGVEIATELTEIGNFHRLHISRDMGYLTFPENRNDSWIRRIKELKLVTCIDAKVLFHIFESAVQLESFSLIVSKPCDIYRPLPPIGKDLNSALLKVANTLKALELRTCHNMLFLSQLGPTTSLTCLPEMRNLKTLAVELPLLTGIVGVIDRKICPRLPPNLVSLEVVEMWFLTQHSEAALLRGNTLLRHRLTTFVLELQASSLPSLERFRLVPSVINRSAFPEQLDEFTALFNQSGVSFSYGTDGLPRRFFARSGLEHWKLLST
ncbi:uncharacterized protein F4812DRAFT_456327 [Daldinia caldariorum]|uniref:uncharacterized protein n=1 Tax=Daldinia caldariorum TaxID=326644 RepID=UPI00200784B8|nr:uncharacterized protein F4812DRAFT_456327 [Daldinia caldariorum]KAI1470322.1 hypothetical protein F4812DRAFT_456327 [Daldinia caldariorum]